MYQSDPAKPDWLIFGLSAGLLALVIFPVVLLPKDSQSVINATFALITQELGVIYIILTAGIIGLLLYVALCPWGNIRLGRETARYSKFSWISMLFCCGIGGSVIYWGATEWVFYYTAPPFEAAARSNEATVWAASYGMFHWGPGGWALYCLPTLAICCTYYLKGIPSLRLSAACEPVIGAQANKIPGRVIDLLFIVGLISSAATGLGFGTSVAASALTRLVNIEDGFSTQLGIISIMTVLIAFSVYRGLDEGIKTLSNVNSVLALSLVAFVFIVGPTQFIAEMSVTAVGNLVQNFFTMLTSTDALTDSDFVESWTVFYWAWWLALGPFVGMFVCKISEGRTLRELIFGMLFWGSAGCALFFMVLGNYALDTELRGLHGVVDETLDVSPSAALASLIERLPLGSFWLAFLAVIGIIFTATTYDSASYTLAAGASVRLAPGEHPARWHRVFWAIALGVLPACLLSLGGLKALQTASVVASLPLLFVYLIMYIAIIKTLREVTETQPVLHSAGG